jgi:hypothetical protein
VTTIPQLVTHLDTTLTVHVTPRLGSTIRQLHEWTGEFSATTPGAAPDSSPAPLDDTFGMVRLSKLESDALQPDEARRALSRIAFLVVALRHADPTLKRRQLQTRIHYVEELANICDRYHPPVSSITRTDICHAHEAAGGDAGISANYRRWHLCRWCGDFRSMHGVNPPPRLVKLHDRGCKITTSMLRSAGVKTGKRVS